MYVETSAGKHHLSNPYFHRPVVKQYAESSITKGFFPPEESGLNFEIPSCLYDSNNQHSAARLRTKCRGGVDRGESMGPICQSSILVNMLEWVGQSSVTPRHITTSLSFTSSFIMLWKGLEEQLLSVNKKWEEILFGGEPGAPFKVQNPYSGGVCVCGYVWERNSTQVIYISDSISLKKKKKSQFFLEWDSHFPLLWAEPSIMTFMGTVT